MVGGLYAPDDERRDAGFSIFYMGINIGGFLAPLVTGFLAQSEIFKSWLAASGFDPAGSWHWGFAAAGVGMTFGLIVFVRQARRLASTSAAPPAEVDRFVGHQPAGHRRHARGPGADGAVGRPALPVAARRRSCCYRSPPSSGSPCSSDIDGQRLAAVFVFFIASMVFWAIFEQSGHHDRAVRRSADAQRAVRLVVPLRLVPVAQSAVRHPAGAALRLAVAAARVRASRRAR